MKKPENGRAPMWWGIFGGMLLGIIIVIAHFCYLEFTHPSPYNAIEIFVIPVFAVVGAIIGLFLAAWYSSD